MVDGDYAVVHVDDAPTTDMADLADVPEQFDPLDVRNVDEALGTEKAKIKVWEIPPGAHMGAHGHETQEECYYVLSGRFELRIGPPGETETRVVEPGTFFAASPEIARGYENVSDEPGRVLVVAAPNVDEGGIPEDEL